MKQDEWNLSGDQIKNLHVGYNEAHLIASEQIAPNLTIQVDRKEMLKLCVNGDIFIRGELMETNKEVMEGLKQLLTTNKIP
jgi:hypothetical protein